MNEIKNAFLYKLSQLKESEDHIEFKEAKRNFDYNGGSHKDPKERRHCILGYVAALANEKGGRLVFGMHDHWPHDVVGTTYEEGNLGALEDSIYEKLKIRVHIDEEFEPSKDAPDKKRVIIFNVPSRPIGKMLKFEGVPLMRTGESLREMSDSEMLKILTEQEPDFSAKVCDGLTLDDLDPKAVEVMKQKYAEKNGNPGFESVTDEQALSDLELLEDGKLTYAALVLLGKSKAIKKYMPQNNVVIEYRIDPASIQYDDRIEIQQPLFLAVDEIWAYINQPTLNPQVHISENAYIFDIKLFNKETIREAVLNAITHRSMIVQNDVVIKLSPSELTITNAGGFPIGVDVSNVLTVNSTPRSKRLAEVLQKTGLVEKSGQGVDKMFTNCIMEAKPLPDFSATDNYQVSLKFRTGIRDVPFLIYIRQMQAKRPRHHKLNVFQLMAIYSVCFGDGFEVKKSTIDELVDEGIVLRSKIGKLSMAKEYQSIYSEIHSTKNVDWIGALKSCAATYNSIITRKTYMEFLPGWISVDRVRYTLSKLEAMNVIKREGTGKGTKYMVIKVTDDIVL
ncbi:MAG: putative DNA binding domain-containing protein [Bacteroidaceae bacterium]|nr:putative DNA binding domain-containing protein [Bacteroidaceae bacterium]